MRRTFLTALLPLSLATLDLPAAPRNFYEWTAVAPIVSTALSLGQDGRYVDARVERVFRGDVEPGELLRIDLRYTNRNRNRNMSPHALHLHEGVTYLLLLEPGPPSDRGRPTYRLVRGVDGAREVPAEGAELLFSALHRFVDVQDLKSDRQIWHALAAMLDGTNPIVLKTALEQFQKFRRGDPEMLLTLRPLLDHPESGIREDAARLIGQIVARHAGQEVPEEAALRGELIAAARRDPATQVRIWATVALGAFTDAAAEEVLEEISESDPEQNVRYAAEKTLLERRKRASGGGFD